MKKKGKKVLFADVPYDLHQRVKINAAARDISIKEFVIDAVVNHLEQIEEVERFEHLKSNEATQAKKE